jgi:hypothetical protein
VPSVLDRRPDCPVRLDLAIQRAMSKDPEDRFRSMGDFVVELEACLAEIDGRGDEGATMIVPAPRRPRRERSHERPAVVMPLLLAALVVALLAAGAFLLFHTGGGKSVLPGASSSSKPVRFLGIRAEDPAHDGEHDSEAKYATDGDLQTYWTTQDYRSFDKPGVGVVLDARRPVALSSMTVESDTPGFPATIRASSSAAGGFTPVSQKEEVGSKTSFHVDTHGKTYRYYEVWLQLPNGGHAHINEVTART